MVGCSDVCEIVHERLLALGFNIDPENEDHQDIVDALEQVDFTRRPKTCDCRYCEHLKPINRPREKYVGMCEYRLEPDTCGKFELAKFYEGHDPRK